MTKSIIPPTLCVDTWMKLQEYYERRRQHYAGTHEQEPDYIEDIIFREKIQPKRLFVLD